MLTALQDTVHWLHRPRLEDLEAGQLSRSEPATPQPRPQLAAPATPPSPTLPRPAQEAERGTGSLAAGVVQSLSRSVSRACNPDTMLAEKVSLHQGDLR